MKKIGGPTVTAPKRWANATKPVRTTEAVRIASTDYGTAARGIDFANASVEVATSAIVALHSRRGVRVDRVVRLGRHRLPHPHVRAVGGLACSGRRVRDRGGVGLAIAEPSPGAR